MRKAVASLALIALATSALPAQALSLEVVSRTVSNTSSTISASNKTALAALLRQNPVANKLSCVGFTSTKPTLQQKSAALTKAKSFCNFAKSVNQKLSVFSATKTSAVKTSMGKVGLTLSIPNSPSSALSFENLDVNWVTRAATTEVLERFEAIPSASNSIKYIVGPTVPTSSLNKEKALITAASRLWSTVFTQSITVVMFSEKDAEWAEQKRLELGGYLPGGISKYLEAPGAKDQCVFGFSSLDFRGQPIYFNCLHSSGSRTAISDHTAIHEHFHLVQNSLYRPNTKVPLWINEGAPTFFGFALGYGAKDRNGLLSEQFYLSSPGFDPFGVGSVDSQRFANWAKFAPDQDIIRVFELLEEDPENRAVLNPYGLGAIAVQVLVAANGVDAYLNFLRKTNQVDWKLAFTETYGIAPDIFYAKLVPYVRSLGKKYL